MSSSFLSGLKTKSLGTSVKILTMRDVSGEIGEVFHYISVANMK